MFISAQALAALGSGGVWACHGPVPPHIWGGGSCARWQPGSSLSLGAQGSGAAPGWGPGGTPVSVSPGALAPEQGGYVGPPSLSLGFLVPACPLALSPEQGVSGTPMALSLGALSPVRPAQVLGIPVSVSATGALPLPPHPAWAHRTPV